MRRSSLIPVIPLLLLFAAGEATAHAFLDHAEPRVGNKVAAPPREVTLWFTQKLEPACCTRAAHRDQSVEIDFEARVEAALDRILEDAG